MKFLFAILIVSCSLNLFSRDSIQVIYYVNNEKICISNDFDFEIVEDDSLNKPVDLEVVGSYVFYNRKQIKSDFILIHFACQGKGYYFRVHRNYIFYARVLRLRHCKWKLSSFFGDELKPCKRRLLRFYKYDKYSLHISTIGKEGYEQMNYYVGGKPRKGRRNYAIKFGQKKK